ncbi:unnamed protein product [Cuscuta campestris]|uniref:Uncharacterized protein n=1 Tax=Cuscuta campestris TaxID=132261 RepID=A0A484KTA0_9ASTE|nr:unnamed protein product [Cuscuta campestris]
MHVWKPPKAWNEKLILSPRNSLLSFFFSNPSPTDVQPQAAVEAGCAGTRTDNSFLVRINWCSLSRSHVYPERDFTGYLGRYHTSHHHPLQRFACNQASCCAMEDTQRQPGWRPLPSRTTPPAFDPAPRMRVDAPRFSGDDPTGWIFRVQKYFDYFLTPEPERLQLVAMLIDHPASEWFHYYQANNSSASWHEFLEAVHQRFDPDYYENYVGLLSKLTQTSTVIDYQAAFEAILNKVSGVPDTALIAMYVAGLRQPLQREVNLRGPTTLQETFALAWELSACLVDAANSYANAGRQPWQSRPGPSGSSPSLGLLPTSPVSMKQPTPAPQNPDKTSTLPIVKLTNAEKTERNDEDAVADELESPEVTSDMALISTDISSIHSLAGSPSPRSLRLAGMINNGAVQVFLDGGSTHNFIHPAVAEHLALPLHPISPFRVYVGNGDSLRCTYSCPQTPLSLQGHCFNIDLYLLEIHGQDVVLGVQWLQTLGKVAHDYSQMTMKFSWKGDTVTLRGDQPHPRPLSYSQFCTLVATDAVTEVFELLLSNAQVLPSSTAEVVFPGDLPEPICMALYGRPPPSVFPTLSVRSKVAEVEILLRERVELLADLRANLIKMQQRMRSQKNQHRRDVSFAVGDLVHLKLCPYRQHSVARPLSSKLDRRYYGPFEVLEHIGVVVYCLRLPEGCRIHDVFRVSLLKPFVARDGSTPAAALPADFFKGQPILSPVVAIASRTVLVNGESQEQWLVRWTDGRDADATWSPSRNWCNITLSSALRTRSVSFTPPSRAALTSIHSIA